MRVKITCYASVWKNSTILTSSLGKALVPSVETIRKIMYKEKNFIQVLHRCGWILPKYQKFVGNVTLLESYGIVGSQLSMLLKRQSRLFVAPQSTLKNYILRAVDMGFNENSRMLVHALHTISGLSSKTFRRKLELIQSFGFSKDESLYMFKRCPNLLRTSEKKLKVGMEFFLHTVMLPKSALVHRPMILMYSIQDRVVPRYKVLQLLISKNLCKKVPSYVYLLCLSEEMFLDKYISRFRKNAESLLVAYKGHHLEA
ncbi:transcription termination factor MTERF5, chloroplastic [Gastrolobium bilobum]|uniref:transcription termination factor MTERF5, chloroplastic n=1 Tax=Gastrolobium bilobum TaxID=150636 RepID=UPI002AB2F0F8|nr:transcription termination factor MTERF5, chloroplastic [Gastrolobium bilobum]